MLTLHNDRKRLKRPEAGSRHDRQNCLGIACKLGWERQDQRIAAVGRRLHELSISGRPSHEPGPHDLTVAQAGERMWSEH